MGKLTQAGSKDLINRIPDFVTSYKPFAKQILTIMSAGQPAEEQVLRMETALNHKLIALGKEGTMASMMQPLTKDFVPKANEKSLSKSLETLIAQSDKEEFSKEDLLPLLKKEISTKNKKEEQKLEQQAQILAKDVNQFLFNRGKVNLKPQDLLDAYQGQIEGGQTGVLPTEKDKVLDQLQSDKVTEKIKTVVITPEEIAMALNDVIPGAHDLHTLIAPELQAVIMGDDPTFKENKEVLQRFLEGTVLRLFVKIAEANQGKDLLVVITEKLKKMLA